MKKLIKYIETLSVDKKLHQKHDLHFCEFMEDSMVSYFSENMPLLQYDKKDIRFRFEWPYKHSNHYIIKYTFTTDLMAKLVQHYPEKIF